MSLSFHSLDRAIKPNIISVSCLTPELFCTVSMPETRKSKGKGKEVEVVVGIPNRARQQSEALDESLSQTSPTPPSVDVPGRSENPPEPPVDASVQ